MEVTRVGVASIGKIVGIIYAAIGVLAGLAIFGVSLFDPLMGGRQAGGGFPSWAFGVGVVILGPVFYGVIGFLAGAFTGWVYNLAARSVGGIHLDLAERRRL